MPRTLWRGLPVLAIVLLALAASPSGAAPKKRGPGAKTQPPIAAMSASPRLYPTFRPDIRDYVVRCGVQGLQLRADAANGSAMWLDGTPVAGPSLNQLMPLRTGESTNLVGRNSQRSVTYHVRCLPSDFPTWRVRASRATPQAEWYLTTPESIKPQPSYVAIFDRHGVPVWWMHSNGAATNATLLANNRIAWSVRQYEQLSSASRPYEIHALDGSRVGTIAARHVNSDWHELRPLSNGHYLILGDRPRDHVNLKGYGGPSNATVLDGVVQEVTATGRVVWSWNTRDHIALSESSRWYLSILNTSVRLPNGRNAYDLVHLNSVEPYGPLLLISSRQTDAIYAVSRRTGRVVWKLGGTHTGASLRPASGTPSYQFFGGQHDVRVLPDGTITVHDNRSLYPEGPRALRIRVDPVRRLAWVIERVSAPSSLHSSFFGSARKLPGGDWVVSWGATSRMAELTPAGRRVLVIDLGSGFASYRAIPIVPGQLPASELRQGMDAMALQTPAGG